jgi:hypothetical protein
MGHISPDLAECQAAHDHRMRLRDQRAAAYDLAWVARQPSSWRAGLAAYEAHVVWVLGQPGPLFTDLPVDQQDAWITVADVATWTRRGSRPALYPPGEVR